MGKISPVSIKYTIYADITLTSVADKPDVIGAIFGQTEGLMGSELELRELQKTGKIGRIEVKLKDEGGKTSGNIIIPSSLDKSETSIIAASLETIDRVGSCEAKIRIKKIEDVRITKRNFILRRAEQLLRNLVETMPDSQEFKTKVTEKVRTLEIKEYGDDKLPAGPMLESNEETIIVEGRADVINLLKYGIKNVIAINGSRAGDTILDIIEQKVSTLFLDGDRGGDLIIKKFSEIAEPDFVARAPDGKEVEELTMKEIQKALRAKITWKQALADAEIIPPESIPKRKKTVTKKSDKGVQKRESSLSKRSRSNLSISNDQKITLKNMSDELIGTRGAFLLDNSFNVLGKVPIKELEATLKNMSEKVFAVIMDGSLDQNLARFLGYKRIRIVVAKSSSVSRSRMNIIESKSL